MKSRLIACFLLFLSVFIGCTKEDVKVSDRTVLIYIVADNNLNKYGYDNLDYILKGAAGQALNGGHLLVYFDAQDSAPFLYEIKSVGGQTAVKHILKEYDEQNSMATDVMKGVVEEALALRPASEYGLVLWSHATAWLPSNVSNMLRSFGSDKGQEMDIADLAAALPDHTFDFILFDACYMANIEVLYELRDKANYIIASPTETLANGFPYDRIITPMFEQKADLEKICTEFYHFYQSQKESLMQSATVSLTATASLNKLTAITGEILRGKEAEIFALPINEMQQLEYLTARYHALYDLDDFIGRLATSEQYDTFRKCLDEAVVYKLTTPQATYAYNNGAQIAMDHFSGLSVYVPQETLPTLNEWYKNLSWYRAVYK